MFPGRPEHLRTFDYLGFHRYSLTFCTFRLARHFVDAHAVDVARSQISRAAREERFALTAYCFMPDHVHLLVEGESDAVLGLLLRARVRETVVATIRIRTRLAGRRAHARPCAVHRRKPRSRRHRCQSAGLSALGIKSVLTGGV